MGPIQPHHPRGVLQLAQTPENKWLDGIGKMEVIL
jgi:hypothetical protein